jgi:hypothetical protein
VSRTQAEELAWTTLAEARAVHDAFSEQAGARFRRWRWAAQAGLPQREELYAEYVAAKAQRDHAKDNVSRARRAWSELVSS